MTLIDNRIGIVVPTRNRPLNVAQFLAAVEGSTIHPAVCIIVDASDFNYDVPACIFPLRLMRPGLRGQVKQRNYGISLLKEFGNIEYALLLDDDILLEPDAINEALAGAARYVNQDSGFVGFALNIVNMGKSSRLSRRLLLHPKQPGVVTRAAFGSSLCNLDRDIECGWVLGGAALWNLDFLIENPNNYPIQGKAYGEDFYYCSMMRAHARFAALSKARCRHIDQYGISAGSCRSLFGEGVSDTKVRMFIARKFPQYSVCLTIMHILWVGALGGGAGMVTCQCKAFMLGMGRLVGLVKRRLLLDAASVQIEHQIVASSRDGRLVQYARTTTSPPHCLATLELKNERLLGTYHGVSMKVLHIITGLSNAGAESILYSLVTSSKEVTHVVISLTDMGFYGDRLTCAGIEVITLNMPKSKITVAGIIRLYKCINTVSPDVIQTWLYHANLVGGIVGRIICRKRVVWGIHHATLKPGTLSKATNLVAHLGAFFSWFVPAKIICCSEGAKKEHARIGYQASKLVIVENGFDFHKFTINTQCRNKIRTEFDIDNETIVFGMVARWDPSKDYPNLVAALAHFENLSGKPWRCLLAGQGMTDSNNQLIELLLKHNISNRVILAGARGDIECVMNALDVLVLSSVSESFGNVLVEAMACGVPVVTTRVGEAEKIVGEFGWVVPPRNPTALAAALQATIDKMDESGNKWRERQLMGRERVVERYGLQRMTQDYLGVWPCAD